MEVQWAKLTLAPDASKPWVLIDASAPGLPILDCNDTFAALIIPNSSPDDLKEYECLQWIESKGNARFKSWVEDCAGGLSNGDELHFTFCSPMSDMLGGEFRAAFGFSEVQSDADSLDLFPEAKPVSLSLSRLRLMQLLEDEPNVLKSRMRSALQRPIVSL
jgi:hypothetical protein